MISSPIDVLCRRCPADRSVARERLDQVTAAKSAD